MRSPCLLTLKGNHPLAHAAVVEHFDQHSGATHEILFPFCTKFYGYPTRSLSM